MSKEFKIFDSYIKNSVKNIKDSRTRNEVGDELFSHLIERYEVNYALGHSDEEAQIEAVSYMGDSEAIATTFKKLYPISTNEVLSTLALRMIYPLIMIWIFENYLPRGGFIIPYLLFSVFANFKNINKFFKVSYVLSFMYTILMLILSVMRNFFVLKSNTVLLTYCIAQVVFFIIYFLFILGTIKVKKEIECSKSSIFASIASIPLIALGCVLLIMRFTENSETYVLGTAIVNIIPAITIYYSIKDFEYLDYHFNLQKKLTKDDIIGAVAFWLCFALSIGTMVLGVNRQPKVSEYNIQYTQSSSTEIRDNLIELGLPEKVANDLPEEEIQNYANAIKVESEIGVYGTYSPMEGTPTLDGKSPYYTFYSIHLSPTNTEAYKIRVLFVMENLNSFEKLHRDKLFIDTDYFSASFDGEETIFFKLLGDIDEETVDIKPFNNDKFKGEYSDDLVYTYTFGYPKNAKDLRIYSAVTIIPKNEGRFLDINLYYTHSVYSSRIGMTDGYNDNFYTQPDNPVYIEPVEDDVEENVTILDDEYIDFDLLSKINCVFA